MLFYISIVVASLIAILLARFSYKAMTNKNRSVHTSNKRVAITDSSRRYQKERTGFKTYNGIPTLSVQEGGMVYSNPGKTHPAKPVVRHNQNTASLIREKKLLSMNGSYKVRRSIEPEPLTLEMVSKPFRRKVAPRGKGNETAIRP
jgi:hypothetical protein